MIKILTQLLILFCFPWLMARAQTATLTGQLVDQNTGEYIIHAQVTVAGYDQQSISDSTGSFKLIAVPYGKQEIVVTINRTQALTTFIDVNAPDVNLGKVNVLVPENFDGAENIPTISLSEADLKESSEATVAGVLNASRDAFASATNYTFSIARFQQRGYDFPNFTTYMNGADISDLTDSRTQYFLYSGLNNVLRVQERVQYLDPATYSFSNLGGSIYIDSRASKQRKQLEINYAAANRTYNNRLMFSYGTGLLKGGWAFAASGSHRWADEGYVKGTYYDSWSYFFSAEKIFGQNHFLSLTVFGNINENGRSGPALQEMIDLSGSNYYNPYWGFQEGQVRNANVAKSHQPVSILSYEWRINSKSTLNAAASFITGQSSISGLDWYNAPDPRPDYYRNLPSYYQATAPDLAAQMTSMFENNEAMRQINWEAMYQTNYFSYDSIFNANGISGNTVKGKRARYILADRITDNQKAALNVFYNTAIKDNMQLSAGANYQSQVSESYNEISDLLGAEFFVDWNQFAERDFPGDATAIQNDLNNPNRIVYEGDKYGYDYKAFVNQASAWGQMQFKMKQVDAFVALNLSQTVFWREGMVRNGIFPDNSYGDSEKSSFFNYAVKGGATYKINGRNYIFANAASFTRAPLFDNSFVSVRTRNELVDGLENENNFAFEGGYLFKSPKIKGRFAAYYTKFNNATRTRSFYHEEYRTLVNYTLTEIDKQHTGIELSAEANVGNGFTVSAVACMGRYLYSDRPVGTATRDNDATILSSDETVYVKNFHDAGGPENAYTLGINYRSPKFWFVNLSFNYFANTWIDFNPARRTSAAVDLVDPDSETWNTIVEQEKTSNQFTMDLFAGYSWRMNNKFKSLKKQTFLVFNLGITNILNNKNLVSGGFEQLRYDFTDHNPEKFPSKYYYAYGTTYYASIAWRIN